MSKEIEELNEELIQIRGELEEVRKNYEYICKYFVKIEHIGSILTDVLETILELEKSKIISFMPEYAEKIDKLEDYLLKLKQELMREI